MSSQRVQVSSGDDFSENTDPRQNITNKKQLLSPTWNSKDSQIKINKAKSTCGGGTKKGSQYDQVLYYKQKAHQSFMQIIQVQELHDEEIEQIKQQFQSRIKTLQKQIAAKNETICILQKNSKHHMLELQRTLQIEGLQLIECRQNNLSKFDESSILNFNQLLAEKQGDSKIQSMRESIFKAITVQINKNIQKPDILIQVIKKQINSVFDYVKEVRNDLITKIDSHTNLIKKYEQIDSNHKKLKVKFDAMQKDALLMSENFRKVIAQKSNLQKRLTEMQKQLRVQQNSKQALLKIAVKQSNMNLNGTSSSKNLMGGKNLIGGSQNLLIKNNANRLKPFKSHRDFEQKSKNQIAADESYEFIDQKKKATFGSNKNEDSFDVKDLMAQMNESKQYNSILNVQKQKKPRLLVSPDTSKLRKKSFDN